MPPRPDVSEERRGQILDAASAVFARLGVRESRMDDIVAQADLSKGALYWYFKSKDDLIAACIERLFARAIENFRDFLKTEQSFRIGLEAIAQYMAADLREIGRMRGVVLEYYALAARDGRVRERVRGYIETFIELFVTMIEHAIERGECHPVDARKTAIAIEAMFEGITLLSIVGIADSDSAATIEHATHLVFDSLLPNA
ncbi:MAG TPA: TetR/AcrR family transcriptional regulator [Candidatus Binataceae bacterium]|nr:TetR/AcrR family transcriptional regulator [Candidatus Binataceae bacterium]